MKKFFLSLVAAIVAATATYAQSSLVATLSHDGTTTNYYGATALSKAHEAAVDGDVITLSPGTFNAVNITKGITLRGAGTIVDIANQKEPTIISGEFEINIDNSTTRLTMEGVNCIHNVDNYGTLENALFAKCRFSNFSNYEELNNCAFTNCVFKRIQMGDNSIAAFSNCVIWSPICTQTSTMECLNCVICLNGFLDSSSFRNCIFATAGTYYISNSNSVYQCIGTQFGGLFDYIKNSTNRLVDKASLFKDQSIDFGTFSDDYSYELTDEAASTYLGLDGTQVGIYGGTVPFDPTPSNPQVTKFEVNSSTANGKLTVKINVE